MRTFFYILITITILIAASLYYVISDNSTVVEFGPDTVQKSDSIQTEKPQIDDINDGTVNKGQKIPKNDFIPEQNQSHQGEQNHSEHSQQFPEITDKTSDTLKSADLSEQEKERIQNEIQTLRNDTQRILKQINQNY